jgi:hypothetical protein
MIDDLDKAAGLLLTDPMGLFDNSVNQLESVDRATLREVQRRAMALRFEEHYAGIEILRKLADKQGITELVEFDDVVPLMFAHTAFKSYPASLLTNKRFDMLAKWLDRQTVYDLSHVDLDGCSGLGEFVERIEDQSELNVLTSSGTTGTMSLIPKSKKMTAYGMQTWHKFMFQNFGTEPTEEQDNAVVDVVWPNFSKGTVGVLRTIPQLIDAFCGGDESRFHKLYDFGIDSDLLVLASQLRIAAAKGELDRVEISPELLAKKEAFEAQLANMPADMARFLEEMTVELAGERIFMVGTAQHLYDMAISGIERGAERVFAPDSIILTGGGMKGAVLPDNWLDIVHQFLGVDRLRKGYGFSEGGTFHWRCELDRYHIMPWVIPFILDPVTSEPLPRTGVVTGRGAFYDLLSDSHWGGVITGDELTIDWDTPCPCGRTSVHLSDDIVRFSEKEGVDDDRITCNATQSFAEEAVDFMRGFQA